LTIHLPKSPGRAYLDVERLQEEIVPHPLASVCTEKILVESLLA